MNAQEKSDRFVELLQGLTAELFLNIRDMVFPLDLESSPGNRVIVKRKYKPPLQLQIDSASRRRLSLDYYSQNTFVFPPRGSGLRYNEVDQLIVYLNGTVSQVNRCYVWLKLLNDENRLAINDIVVELTRKPFKHYQHAQILGQKDKVAHTLRERLEKRGLTLKQGALRVKLAVKTPDGDIVFLYGQS